jgi:hypothetical protein
MANPDSLLRIAERVAEVPESATNWCDEFSTVLHDLRMGGVWKRTARGRLKRTVEMLCAHMPRDQPQGPVLLDIGASDGITTVEAIRALRQVLGGNVQALLADLNLSLLRYRWGPVVEYRASDGEPIMTRVGCFGIRLAKHRRGAERGQNRIANLYLRSNVLRKSMGLDASISLVNPLALSEPGITIMELNCLVREKRLEAGISAIRASNVLNIGYFDLPQLRTAIGNLHAYLRERGCLVVSRNDDDHSGESENGSVWYKDANHFRWVEDFGAGSEIKSVVDSWSSV